MKKNPPIMKACEFFRLDVSLFPSTVEQLVEEMEEAGVSKSVILGQDTHATRNPSFKHYTLKNAWLAQISGKSQGRLIPFAGIDPNAVGEALGELKRAVKQLGMKGLKIHSSANSVFPNDKRRMYPIYDFCQEVRVPILFHTGTTGLGYCEVKYSKP
jgi:predicted TIM-barrel fold metal-dependent hydrolase